MAKILQKRYRSFIDSNGKWTDPLFDYGPSTTYHHDDNADEFDTVDESVSGIIDGPGYDIPALPSVGTRIDIDDLYTYQGSVYRVRQSHNVTIYNPGDVPALFTVYRTETDGMEWVDGEQVDVGTIRSYDSVEFVCIQAHQTQSDWTPDRTPTLWEVYEAPGGDIEIWVQPTGAHDAYRLGDLVLYNDKTWECISDYCVYAPGVFGWKLI